MFSRILLATDFSEAARPSVDWAGGLAALEGGTVVVVHALEHDLVAHAPDFSGWLESEDVDLGNYKDEIRRAAEKALQGIAERLEAKQVEVETHLLEGRRPSEVLAQAVIDLKCSVMVLANQGRGGMARWLLGSTAEKVIRTSPCPVLIVHDGDSAPG